MGVQALLKHLGPLIPRSNIYTKARGKRIGIDGHVWLHQLAYQFAEDIVVRGDYTSLAFLQLSIVALGQGVELLFVFDGAPTPAKRQTDQAPGRIALLEKLMDAAAEAIGEESAMGILTPRALGCLAHTCLVSSFLGACAVLGGSIASCRCSSQD